MTFSHTDFEAEYALAARGYSFCTENGVGLYTLPLLDRLGAFSHGFTARTGGVSKGCFSSLNLSFTRPEERENVRENFRRFAAGAGFSPDSMVLDNYEHGTTWELRTI